MLLRVPVESLVRNAPLALLRLQGVSGLRVTSAVFCAAAWCFVSAWTTPKGLMAEKCPHSSGIPLDRCQVVQRPGPESGNDVDPDLLVQASG